MILRTDRKNEENEMFVGFLFGGPEKSAGQVACVAGGFLACFLFCGSQRAGKLNRGRNRKR